MRALAFVVCSLVFSLALPAQSVTLNAVMNNASYALPGTPNEAIAQGSLFALFGSNLAVDGLWQVSQFPLQPLTPAGTSVKVTVGGKSVDALPVYTSPKQVGAILPSDCPTGDGTVVLTYNGQASAPLPVRIVRSGFGIFAQNQQGTGSAAAQNFNAQSDQPMNSPDRPATPGQTVILWGTGLGPIAAPDNGPPLVGDLLVNATVWVGGRQARILYKGRSGCCAGIDQVIFTVPEESDGCHVPVVVEVDEIASNFTSIAVASPGKRCTLSVWPQNAPMPIGDERLRYGVFQFQRATSHSYSDSTSLGILGIFGRLGSSDFSWPVWPPAGTCTATAELTGDTSYESLSEPLDAGQLTLSGPLNGVIVMEEPGYYYADGHTSGPGFPAGTYTIDNGAGGKDVRSFKTSLVVDEALVWTNHADFFQRSVDRDEGLKVTWATAAGDGLITISGASTIGSSRSGVLSQFVCTAPLAAGEFTVPAVVLRSLPASASYGYLQVSRIVMSTFKAEGLDTGIMSYLEGGYTTDIRYK